jgi:Asp-tRNA(Asn)/Glu-tRNA(Gln) amidotransferase B subunit
VLVSEKAIADYFDTGRRAATARLAANWVINELFGG